MAPSTPPPPSKEELAALTMASVVSFVMSAGPCSSRRLSPANTSRKVSRPTRFPQTYLVLFSESHNPWKLLALQKFQRRAAAGRDMGNLVCDPGSFYS